MMMLAVARISTGASSLETGAVRPGPRPKGEEKAAAFSLAGRGDGLLHQAKGPRRVVSESMWFETARIRSR
jgi:hypothetical protein